MIGPGTGIAPFRAFLQERLGVGSQLSKDGKGNNWLFFGCRHESRDFLYADELSDYVRMGGLKLITAFSRDQADRKVYVQDRLTEHGREIWEEIDAGGAHVYVCGDAGKMAADVHSALLQIFQKNGQLSPAEADKYMAHLEKEHRYQRDVWAS